MDKKIIGFTVLLMIFFISGVEVFAKVGVYSEMNSETLRGPVSYTHLTLPTN